MSLGEEVRGTAIRLASLHIDEPQALNAKSWLIVRDAGGDRESYAAGARWAEVACRLAPDEGRYLNTLGVAQYRMGEYEKALVTLARSDELNCGIPADVAFLAMSHHRLGHEDAASEALARLRVLMQDAGSAEDFDAKSLLREAEMLISGAESSTARDK